MASISRIERLERRQRIFALYAQRKTITAIAAEIGVTYNTVRSELDRAFREMSAPIVQHEFQVDLEVLQQSIAIAIARYKTTKNPRDAVTINMFLQRRAKMLGLDAAVVINVHQVDQQDLAILDLINAEKAKNVLQEQELTADEHVSD